MNLPLATEVSGINQTENDNFQIEILGWANKIKWKLAGKLKVLTKMNVLRRNTLSSQFWLLVHALIDLTLLFLELNIFQVYEREWNGYV